MKILFKNIVPHPLSDLKFDKDSVWSNSLKWESPKITLLNAVSGKGKSTFVDILSGVRKDFTGDLILDGKSTNLFTLNEWSEYRTAKISTVYQDLQLLSNFTVWENLMIKNKLTNYFRDQEIIELLSKLGIIDFKNKICKNLSLGQQQRVAIIRAMCQPFKLLLLDEPFSHLDKDNESKVWEILLTQIKNNNAGLIITTLGEKPKIKVDSELNL